MHVKYKTLPMTSGAIKKVSLFAGELVIKPAVPISKVDGLLSFASRYNNKRQYMFASNVLGKYIPATPNAMAEAQNELLEQVTFKNETTTFIGFAESACGLGEALFTKSVENNVFLKSKAAYIHTTRQFNGQDDINLHFIEPHSHAADQVLMTPKDRKVRSIMDTSTTLALVEDEITTGNTMANFLASYLEKYPSIRRVEILTYVDWRTSMQKISLAERFPQLEISTYALITGEIAFNIERDNLLLTKKAKGDITQIESNASIHDARYGVMYGEIKTRAALTKLASLTNEFTMPMLIIGTSEFTYWAQKIASEAQSKGGNCVMLSTTRAPLQVRDDIHSKLEFVSHYGDGEHHYLYNIPTDRMAFICYETRHQAEQHHELRETMKAHALILEDE